MLLLQTKQYCGLSQWMQDLGHRVVTSCCFEINQATHPVVLKYLEQCFKEMVSLSCKHELFGLSNNSLDALSLHSWYAMHNKKGFCFALQPEDSKSGTPLILPIAIRKMIVSKLLVEPQEQVNCFVLEHSTTSTRGLSVCYYFIASLGRIKKSKQLMIISLTISSPRKLSLTRHSLSRVHNLLKTFKALDRCLERAFFANETLLLDKLCHDQSMDRALLNTKFQSHMGLSFLRYSTTVHLVSVYNAIMAGETNSQVLALQGRVRSVDALRKKYNKWGVLDLSSLFQFRLDFDKCLLSIKLKQPIKR